MENTAHTLKKTARFAGLLYLLWVITAAYGIMYVPSHTMVKGDTAATASRIVANEFLFRTGIANDILGSVIWLLLALTLYRLLKQVNARQAQLLVALVIVQIPAVFLMEAFSLTSLLIFKGELLPGLELSQRQDLAMLFLKTNYHGTVMLETYWGLWLFPFAALVYRSGYIPRLLGVLLFLNGVAYILHAFTTLLYPVYQTVVYQWSVPVWTLGEISIMLWLLIKGVKNHTEHANP